MSRKHYVAFAKIIAAQREHARLNASLPDTELHAAGLAVLTSTRSMAMDVADLFRADNSRFDRGRFLDACGIAEPWSATGEASDR